MNDNWLERFRKNPRPEFSEALYKRISEPMKTQQYSYTLRRVAQGFAALIIILVVTLALSPSARAVAGDAWRKIGAFLLSSNISEGNIEPKPTVAPPTGQEVQFVGSALEAGEVAGFSAFTPDYLPEGYTQEGKWGVLQQGEGVIVLSHYTDADQHFLHIDQFKPGLNDEYEQFTNNSQDVTVRGQPGVWITGRQFGNTPGEIISTSWLMWEKGGINYTIYSDALTLEETLKVAESLMK